MKIRGHISLPDMSSDFFARQFIVCWKVFLVGFLGFYKKIETNILLHLKIVFKIIKYYIDKFAI